MDELASQGTARMAAAGGFANPAALAEIGMDAKALAGSIAGTYRLLDRVDATLEADGVEPLCQIVELANLSSMIGNIIGAEFAKNSKGLYVRNAPHRYPDLLSVGNGAVVGGIEIKMAFNYNQPKGHLAKEGQYITCRYVLIGDDGAVITEKADRLKARKACIWEVRTGHLEMAHFNISNTEGDSGKTAVVNAAGMEKLKVVFADLEMIPGQKTGARFKRYSELFRV